jgi:hypothetical protein
VSLPAVVVEQDHKLAKSAEELMKHRFHWTLDENNPNRIGFTDYARQVGVDEKRIRTDAKAWVKYLAASADPISRAKPGAPQTPDDFKELENVGEEAEKASIALAKAYGTSPGNVAKHMKKKVKKVVTTARGRAAKKGTTIAYEIRVAAKTLVQHEKDVEKEKEDHKAAHSDAFIDFEGDAAAVMLKMKKMIKSGKGLEFDEEESELILETLGRLQDVLNLLKLAFSAEALDVDWDMEFQRITSGLG